MDQGMAFSARAVARTFFLFAALIALPFSLSGKGLNYKLAPEELYASALEYLYGNDVDLNPRKASSLLKKAAAQNHARAQNLLALLYLEGQGVRKSMRQSAYWFQQSAENNYPPAMYNLGYAYITGRGVSRDYQLAHEWLMRVVSPEKPLAVSPEDFAFFKEIVASSQYQIGLMHATGVHVERDLTTAAAWIEKAADEGNYQASLYMASAFARGEGVSRDIERSNHYLQMMSLGAQNSFRMMLSRYYFQDVEGAFNNELNHLAESFDEEMQAEIIEKQIEIALGFLNAENPDRNPSEAIKWLRLASGGGSNEAKHLLANLLYRGIGTSRDLSEAYRNYADASEGSPIAAYNRAVLIKLGEAPSDADDYENWLSVAAKGGLYVALQGQDDPSKLQQMNYDEILQACIQAADAGDPKAEYCLAIRHMLGRGVEKNVDEARRLYESSARKGYADGQHGIGAMYYLGYGMKKDLDLARKWFEKAGEQNHAEALFRLGLMYESGTGVDVNMYQSFNYYSKAAELGHVSAQNNLGVMLWSEKGPYQNKKKGIHYLRMAADKGDQVALYNLAIEMLKGKRLDHDPEESLNMLMESAEKGYANAQLTLAKLFDLGHYVEEDASEAAVWYEKAAEQGIYEAQMKIAAIYKTGEGVPRSRTKALIWYGQASQLASFEAMCEVAKLHKELNWSGSDPARAKDQFAALIKDGYAPAYLELAEMYESGIGMKANPRKAMRLYKSCAKIKGFTFAAAVTDSMYHLGRCLHEGVGGKADVEKAFSWYSQAAERGHSQAQYEIALMYLKGTGIGSNLSEAMKWMRFSAENKNVGALEFLGMAYVKGQAGAPERDEAIAYLKLALELGSVSAQQALRKLGVEIEKTSPTAPGEKNDFRNEEVAGMSDLVVS